MGCICNCFVGLLNCVLLTVGIGFVISGAYLNIKGNSDCEKVLTTPLIVMGGLLLILSLIGIMGTSCSSTFCMYIYLTLMFLLILGVIAFTIFVFMITNQAVGKVIADSEKVIEPKNPMDFSNWLANKVNKENNWKKIKSCLIDARLCTTDEYKLEFNFLVLVDQVPDIEVYNKSLPALQAACCKPPDVCGYTQKNELVWEVPKSGPSTKDKDCKKWSNDGDKMCFECDSCKVGVVENLKREWKALALINICLLAFLILIYMLGCCAFCC
ncbi:tetraspanin-8-like [Gossypium australe]|uniref:Tetraspanin-8-like n=1 Tax=Gossypium australe TaxID=47621 RepID=A0A5B6W3E1_9ROSI|nr:tetraspanin-8-like [Gossypium australe]